jgi:hypothetical protein
MVINYINIDKTNNQKPLIPTELTEHQNTTAYGVGNPDPDLGCICPGAHVFGVGIPSLHV